MVSKNTTIYGSVDCTRDLDNRSCTTCLLLFAVAQLKTCCLGTWQSWIASPSCNLQVSLDAVYADMRRSIVVKTDDLGVVIWNC